MVKRMSLSWILFLLLAFWVTVGNLLMITLPFLKNGDNTCLCSIITFIRLIMWVNNFCRTHSALLAMMTDAFMGLLRSEFQVCMSKTLKGKFLFYMNSPSMFTSVLCKTNWFYNFLTRFENWKTDLHNSSSYEEMFKFYLQMYLNSLLRKSCICKLHSTGVCVFIFSELWVELK